MHGDDGGGDDRPSEQVPGVNRRPEYEPDWYEQLFKSMTEGFCVIEKEDTPPGEPVDFRFVEANPAFKQQTGVGDVVGKTIREVVPGEPQEWFDTYNEVVETGEAVWFERELVSQGRILEVYAFPIGDPADRQAGVLFRDVTERVERERELVQYRSLTEAATDAIITIDETSTIQSANPAVADIFGYAPTELVGKPLMVLMPGDLAGQHREALRRYLETGEKSLDWNYVELPGRHKDGRRVPLAISFSETTFANETFFTGIIRDNSPQKAYERELERLLDLLERTEQTANVGGWEIDTETMEVFWSNQIFELLQWPGDEEPPLEEALDLYHPQDRPVVEEAVETALSAGEPFEVEARIRPVGGEVIWLRVQGKPEIRDGEVVAVRGAAQDITAQKERERELERARRRMELALEVTGATVWEWDYERDVVTTHPSPHGLQGTEHETVEDFLMGVHEDDRPVVEEALAEAIETNEPYHLEYRYNDGDAVRWAEDYGEIRTVGDGGRSMMLGVARDVTDRKQRELALRESNERLEQFAHAASHDLREPLRMVSSYLQLLEKRHGDAIDAEGREFLEFAVEGAQRMQTMIAALLEYSRVDTHGEPFEPVDLAEVLKEVRGDLRVKIEETDTELVVDALPRVYGDSNQLRQVFQNLLDNAIEYSGNDPPRVEITARRRPREWVVSVRDEGIGIDPDHQARVFEVFHRLHSQDEHPGAGIGLSLCERIIERHGGRIWVESEPGVGSTFSFTLPAGSDR